MITVLADDLSGAAEIGGACLVHGLAAEVQTAASASRLPAVCVDTDTRSLPALEAAWRVSRAFRLLPGRPDGWFVKVDSVLRGPVGAVLAGLLAAAQLPRALLVSANPARGRVLHAGQVFIHGQPLHETEFARDPEHPASTADAVALLGHDHGLPVSVIKPGQPLPSAGIIIGEAESTGDLAHWAAQVDESTLPAGAAEFFAAWLERHGHPAGQAAMPASLAAPGRTLVVSGSTSAASSQFCQRSEARGIPVLRMPPDLFAGVGPALAGARWEIAVRRALAEHPVVVVAIDQPPQPEPPWPARLRAILAGLVTSVLAGKNVARLYIEGGATARAIIERLGWRRLRVCGQLAPGVVVLEPPGLAGPLLVLKPGSYDWQILGDLQAVRE